MERYINLDMVHHYGSSLPKAFTHGKGSSAWQWTHTRHESLSLASVAYHS
jgi:hypothetical protein